MIYYLTRKDPHNFNFFIHSQLKKLIIPSKKINSRCALLLRGGSYRSEHALRGWLPDGPESAPVLPAAQSGGATPDSGYHGAHGERVLLARLRVLGGPGVQQAYHQRADFAGANGGRGPSGAEGVPAGEDYKAHNLKKYSSY